MVPLKQSRLPKDVEVLRFWLMVITCFIMEFIYTLRVRYSSKDLAFLLFQVLEGRTR